MKKDIYKTIKKVVFLYLPLLLILFPEAGFAGKDAWTFTGDLSLQATETIRSIAINPIDSTIIYAGNDTSVIFKSTNGGLSWSSLNGIRFDIEGTSSNKRIIDIIIDPNYPDTLLAASDSGGVYRSYNGGTTWLKVGKPSAGLNDTTISALAMNSNNSDIIYAGTDSGVYKSEDKGTTWYSVNNGLQQDTVNIQTLAIDPVNPNILYVGTSTSKIYRTDDAGGTWSLKSTISGSPVITKIAVDPKSPNKIYVATQSNAVYYSSNRGLTFTQIADGLP
ncbi:hypothetical protein KAS50_10125, partial [bacterium]|nr:hypothetical protein [bacterium]